MNGKSQASEAHAEDSSSRSVNPIDKLQVVNAQICSCVHSKGVVMVRVAIIGASGYTGAESVAIIGRHGQAKLTYLTALPEECGRVGDVFARFKGRCDLEIEPLDLDKLSKLADVALCCLPHKVSMGFVPQLLKAGVKVVDFSADYRLKDVDVYKAYYNVKHTDSANLAKAAFGLPEF
ncbi:MAG: hypothetical protein ACYSRZ_06135, partial [Planctomycetota bacterium]